MTEMTWNRIAGACAVAFLPLIVVGFGLVVGFSPAIDQSRDEITRYYGELSFGRAMFGEWLEVLAFAALLVFAARLATLVRTDAAWLGWLALSGASVLAAAAVVGIAPLIAAAYLADHGGLEPSHAVTLNAVRVAIHWLSTVFAGVWMLATAALVLTTGLFPRWLGIAGTVVAMLLLASVAAPLVGGVDLAQLLMSLWILIAGVILIRSAAAPAVARAAA